MFSGPQPSGGSRLLAGSEDPWATYAAFVWELQDNAVDDITKGEVASTVSATIGEDRASANMLVDALAYRALRDVLGICQSVSTPMQSNHDLYSKIIHTRARWRQPRCALRLQNCLRIAPIFPA